MERGLLRLVDANANRAREGLRVAEDVARFVLGNQETAAQVKELRHKLTELCSSFADDGVFLAERDSERDPGRRAGFDTGNRSKDLSALVRRNMRRSEEACRVLEEVFGLEDGDLQNQFKELRFAMYDAEKALLRRL